MEQAKALLIVTYRNDEPAADHPLLALISSLPQEAVRRLPLQPLSEAAMAELARRAGRPPAECEHGRQAGVGAVHALVALGRLQARRGDPDAAATLQEAKDRAYTTDELQWIGPVAAARAEHAWLQGDADLLAEEASGPFRLAVKVRHPWFVGELSCWFR
jgi:hypothetical protein